jgi:hypothetical protein
VLATNVVDTTASVATTLAIAAVVWQLVLTRRQMTASFERTFVERYERIIASVPLEMLTGESVDIARNEKVLRAFFDYFELCEEELYYRQARRVSDSAWSDWSEGIELNLRRPAFREAWATLDAMFVVAPARRNQQRHEQFTLLRGAIDAFHRGEAFDPQRGRFEQLRWNHR